MIVKLHVFQPHSAWWPYPISTHQLCVPQLWGYHQSIALALWYCLQYINGLVQGCSNSSALALELLQSCTKPLICNQGTSAWWPCTVINPILLTYFSLVANWAQILEHKDQWQYCSFADTFLLIDCCHSLVKMPANLATHARRLWKSPVWLETDSCSHSDIWQLVPVFTDIEPRHPNVSLWYNITYSRTVMH